MQIFLHLELQQAVLSWLSLVKYFVRASSTLTEYLTLTYNLTTNILLMLYQFTAKLFAPPYSYYCFPIYLKLTWDWIVTCCNEFMVCLSLSDAIWYEMFSKLTWFDEFTSFTIHGPPPHHVLCPQITSGSLSPPSSPWQSVFSMYRALRMLLLFGRFQAQYCRTSPLSPSQHLKNIYHPLSPPATKSVAWMSIHFILSLRWPL